MKKTNFILGVAFSIGMLLTSCDHTEEVNSKQGQLNVSLKANSELFVTRAVNENSYMNTENYSVVVTDNNGNVRLNCLGRELGSKMPITLPLGGFTVKAFYGTEHAYSRDEFYVEGIYKGNIVGDDMQHVAVTCAPTCGRIVVNFSKDMMDKYFADYNVSFTGTEAMGTESIIWSKDDSEPWYVKLAPDGETISYTIKTKTKEEYVDANKNNVTTKTGTFKLSRNKAYKLSISPVYTPTDQGKLDIEITIDESTNDIESDSEVDVDWV